MKTISSYVIATFLVFLLFTAVKAQTTDTTRTNKGQTGNTGQMGNTGQTDTNRNDNMTGSRTSSSTAPDPAMVRASIEQASSQFQQAINSGNTLSATNFYTDEAIIMPPDIDMIKGSTGIRNFWSKLVGAGVKFDTLQTEQVMGSGNDYSEVGRYYLKIDKGDGSNAVSEKGKFVFVWERQPDNSWKIAAHIWNRSK
ncbi:MAG: YybH family protein [Methanococcaceae archaeon]